MTAAVAPTVKDVAEALTDMLVTPADSTTVTLAEPLCPPDAAMIKAVPTALAVATPVVLMLATDESVEPHVALTFPVVPLL